MCYSCFLLQPLFLKQLEVGPSIRKNPSEVESTTGILQTHRQCCGSGMFIPDPDFYPSRIPDPKTATKERGEKKFDVIPFYVATNVTKLYIILVLKC
jgi:hypothetical protein